MSSETSDNSKLKATAPTLDWSKLGRAELPLLEDDEIDAGVHEDVMKAANEFLASAARMFAHDKEPSREELMELVQATMKTLDLAVNGNSSDGATTTTTTTTNDV